MDSRALQDQPSSQDDYCSSFRLADWLVQDAIDARSEQLSAPTPDTIEAVHDGIADHHSPARGRSGSLPLLQLADWSEDVAYDEHPPTCIHYSIEWKLTVNGRVAAKDTEQNLVLAPNAYWDVVLRFKLDKLLRKKLPSNKAFRADDTNVVLSVTDRSERDLVKRFDELDIDWDVLEKQLEAWGHLFRAGKKLRMNISFNYLETGPAAGVVRHGAKRGPSASQNMLSERAMQLDAEEEASGQPSAWRDVYNLMRCPGPPCHLGPHCWRDPVSMKHYKLKTYHLRSVIKRVEQGYRMQTHDDLPTDIREQLYAEEHQDLERQRKRTASSPTGYPPINITNVMPGQSPPAEASYSAASTPASRASARLDIPGLRDSAVRRYSDWQCSQVGDESLKTEYLKACDLTLDDGLDLEQVFEDQDAQFYVDKGVKRGIARRFVRDIEVWATHYM